MIMTKTLLWFVAIMIALLGVVAATEVPVSGSLIVLAAYLITPLSPLPGLSKKIAARYEDAPSLPLLRGLVYLLPVLFLAIGFTGIGQHRTSADHTTPSAQLADQPAAPPLTTQ